MIARSKVSLRKPSLTRLISLSWQYSRALSRTMRSSDVNSLSSSNGSSQLKGLRSSFADGFAALCSAADIAGPVLCSGYRWQASPHAEIRGRGRWRSLGGRDVQWFFDRRRDVELLFLVGDVDVEVPQDIHADQHARIRFELSRVMDAGPGGRRGGIHQHLVQQVGDNLRLKVLRRDPVERQRLEDVAIGGGSRLADQISYPRRVL